MRYAFLILVVLCGCGEVSRSASDSSVGIRFEEVVQDVDTGVEDIADADAVEEDGAPWRHHSNVVPVSAMRLNSKTRGSSRLMTVARTDVQRAAVFHGSDIDRRASEASIIRGDASIRDQNRMVALTVLVLARIGVSESGWDGDGDLRGIYQVLRNTRRGRETLLSSMRRHSRIVSELWSPRSTRERWLSELNLDETRPPHFTMDQESWDRTYRRKWHAVLGRAIALVEGRDRVRQCPVPVIAWGGRCEVAAGACDDHIALRRGLVQVESCGDTRNRFWSRVRYFGERQLQTEMAWRKRKGMTIDDGLSRSLELGSTSG